MVGRMPLEHAILVRIQVPEFKKYETQTIKKNT